MSNDAGMNNYPPSIFMSRTLSTYDQIHHPVFAEQVYVSRPSHMQPQKPHFYNPKQPISIVKQEKRKQETLTCDTCGIEVNSQQMMDAHIRGQKHIKKMKHKVASATNVINNSTPNSTPTIENPTDSTSPSRNATNESTLVSETNSGSPIHQKKSTNEKSVLQLMNELAKRHKITPKYDLIKETGPAHHKQFEVQLTLGEEMYTGTGTSIKRAQQVAAEVALEKTVLKKAEQTPRVQTTPKANHRNPTGASVYSNVPHQNFPTIQQYVRPKSLDCQYKKIVPDENLLEKIINEKHAEISESEQTLELIQRFVEDIERGLKNVSDKLLHQCQKQNMRVVPNLPDNVKLNNVEENSEDVIESFRMLKGAMKVSHLAMRLFLVYNYEYTLVLICANKPTTKLLDDICAELNISLNAQAISAIHLDSNAQQSGPRTYRVEAQKNEACLTVQSSILPNHSIQILLTSPVFRSENFINLDDLSNQKLEELNPDPIDMLDKARCLEAAAEIRHSNWFTHCMLEHRSNIVVLNLLSDLQHHNTPLSYLNLWSLALLVYKCQSQPPNSSAALFRSVFSCLSSGILLPNNIGPGIIDPCEKDLADASAYLTFEQRLNITKYSQYILRLLAFGHYKRIFHFKSKEF